MFRFSLGVTVLLIAANRALSADEFPQPYDSETDLATKRMSPEESAKAFQVPEGFKVQVFAAEPDVRNPIAAAWDTKGRLWIAENYTYAGRPLQFDLGLRDRVLIFADKDGDGKFDERKVFYADAQRLTGLEVGLGGVWLMCPPQLLFVPDKDGDDVPDGPPEAMLEGFTVPPENFHNFANGLHWGPDGWLYGRCGASSPGLVRRADAPGEYEVPLRGGIWRFHPRTRQFDALCHGTTNPWGHDWDANGECFFINTVNGHLWHMIPGAHYARPHTINANPLVYEAIDQHADHYHWDTGGTWADSRKQSPLNSQLGGGHAHVGMTIYGGEMWPKEYRGQLFTLNEHGHRMNVDRLEREGSGYVGKHEPDMLKTTDEWFRGVEVTYGPDGGVYLIDWNDTGECHEATGVVRSSGRIYKVTYGDAKPTPPVDLTKLNESELVDMTAHSTNEWFVRAARRELADRQSHGIDVLNQIKEIDKKASSISRPVTSINVLRLFWGQTSIGKLKEGQGIGIYGGGDERERSWSIKLLLDQSPLDTPIGTVRATTDALDSSRYAWLVESARKEESALVRLTCASALQRLPVERRPALAAALLSHAEDADDHNLPPMIWYGLIPIAAETPEKLAPLAAESRIPRVTQWIARRSGEVIVKRPAALDALVAATAKSDDAVRADVVRGLVVGLSGLHKAKAPAGWPEYASSLASASTDVADALRAINVVFGDGRALDEVRKLALDGKADIPQRRAALETLIEAKPDDLREICEKLIKTRFMNTTALQGLTRFDDPEIGRQLAKNFKQFHHSERSAVMDALTSRPSFAGPLLDEIAAGKIDRNVITPTHARQIRALNDEQVTKQLVAVWGELRDSPKDKQDLMDRLKKELTPAQVAKAHATNGRAIFAKSCANCHRLFGAGGEIGPDLTGANRKNLDYILQNVVDPSAVVNKDFLMTVFTMADGRVVSGIVLRENEETVTVQTAQQKQTLLKSDVEERSQSKLSLMPDGLLQPLNDAQIGDLTAYLMSDRQVDLPVEINQEP